MLLENIIIDFSLDEYYTGASGKLYKLPTKHHPNFKEITLNSLDRFLSDLDEKDSFLEAHIQAECLFDIDLFKDDENQARWDRLSISYNLEEKYVCYKNKYSLTVIDENYTDKTITNLDKIRNVYLGGNPINVFNSLTEEAKYNITRNNLIYVSPETHAEFFNFAKTLGSEMCLTYTKTPKVVILRGIE